MQMDHVKMFLSSRVADENDLTINTELTHLTFALLSIGILF